MKLANVSALIVALLALAPATSQPDEQLTDALNNVQHDMSTCIAYQMLVQECVQKQDPELGVEYATLTEHLIRFAVEIGSTIGMTEDAMTSRITNEQGQMRALIQNNCVNISSLSSRHALRCKQLVEDSDSVLREYLSRD